MNPLRILAEPACGAVQPAALAPALASLTRRVGRGLHWPMVGCCSQSALQAWPAWALDRASGQPADAPLPAEWVLQGDQGALWLGARASAWLAGLTGVDLRAAEDARTLDWLRSCALALLPPPWRSCFHTLARATAAPPQGLVPMRMDLRTDDHVLTTHAWAAAHTWRACLAGWLPPVPADKGSQWRPWPAVQHAVVARHRLPAHHARSLRPGDIVVPAEPLFDSCGVGLWRCGQQVLRVQAHFDHLEVLEMQDGLDVQDLQGVQNMQDMQDMPSASPGDAAPGETVPPTIDAATADVTEPPQPSQPLPPSLPPSPLQGLPLTLEFSLGCVRSTLGELSELAPGVVLALERAWAPGCVSVRVGEREVGLGELVQVQGQLAVRLTEWDAR